MGTLKKFKLGRKKKPSRKAFSTAIDRLLAKKAHILAVWDYKREITTLPLIFECSSQLFKPSDLHKLFKLFREVGFLPSQDYRIVGTEIEPRGIWVLRGDALKITILLEIHQYIESALSMTLQHRYKQHLKQKKRGTRNPEHFSTIESELKKDSFKLYLATLKNILADAQDSPISKRYSST